MTEEVRLDGELYDQAAVDVAAQAYAELASIVVSRLERDIVASVTSTSEGDEFEELVDSFCNHALFETISRRQMRWQGQTP